MSRSPPERRVDSNEGQEAAASGGRNVGRGWRRGGDSSSSRPRSAEAVWPEHFVEAVAAQVAVDAARDGGRLAAAPAVVAVFQVCSTWRAISQSELLWQDLVGRIWNRRLPSFPSWRDDFIHLHRTAANFRSRRSTHSRLLAPSAAVHSCRRMTISEHHLAAGFLDGSVRLFDLPGGRPLATFHVDPHRDRLGPFSHAVAGIVLEEAGRRLAFASQDGDVHVATLGGNSGSVRRAHIGSLMEFGILVDFAGDDRRWVGLFAGPPGWSWHVWDAATEEVLYRGGTLTDPDGVAAWHMLTDASVPAVGRVRMAAPGVAVGCTVSSMEVMDVDSITGRRLNRVDLRHGAVVGSVDAGEGRAVVVDSRGLAKVLHVPALHQICCFSTVRRGEQLQQRPPRQQGEMEGCMNWGYVVVCAAGGVRVWDARTGEYLYSFRERVGEVSAVAAGDRYVVAWANDTGLHVWDYGAL